LQSRFPTLAGASRIGHHNGAQAKRRANSLQARRPPQGGDPALLIKLNRTRKSPSDSRRGGFGKLSAKRHAIDSARDHWCIITINQIIAQTVCSSESRAHGAFAAARRPKKTRPPSSRTTPAAGSSSPPRRKQTVRVQHAQEIFDVSLRRDF